MNNRIVLKLKQMAATLDNIPPADTSAMEITSIKQVSPGRLELRVKIHGWTELDDINPDSDAFYQPGCGIEFEIYDINTEAQKEIIKLIKTQGYSKYLKGIKNIMVWFD